MAEIFAAKFEFLEPKSQDHHPSCLSRNQEPVCLASLPGDVDIILSYLHFEGGNTAKHLQYKALHKTASLLWLYIEVTAECLKILLSSNTPEQIN